MSIYPDRMTMPQQSSWEPARVVFVEKKERPIELMTIEVMLHTGQAFEVIRGRNTQLKCNVCLLGISKV